MRNLIIIFLMIRTVVFSMTWFVPMDDTQKDHLKAYGVVYKCVENGYQVNWLLNYRGGSFQIEGDQKVESLFSSKGVSVKAISPKEAASIQNVMEESNTDKVLIEKATKIAVYTPDTSNPWDDAVTLALEYAQIPYDKIYDEEILAGDLIKYDWLHLHHEDFTGQLGKFYAAYSNADWYLEKFDVEKKRALRLGYKDIPSLKKAVALKIREYVENGGFLFAMCAATDTLDIALSAVSTDIVPQEIDESPVDDDYKGKLDFRNCFAFKDFNIITNPYIYEFSDIDIEVKSTAASTVRTFKLFEFSARFDRTATILTQNHRRIISDFLGQTTAFKKNTLKEDVLVLGFIQEDIVKYIHGIRGKGTFTFLGGHDPEDYAHLVGEAPTDLSLYKNSPGYRLILNNVLFPAVKKKKLKT